MNIEAKQAERSAREKSATKLKIIDCDIHPKSSLEDYRPYLSNRWWDYAQTYGSRSHHGYVKGFPYPKGQPLASRRDSWPPDGGLPASNYEFMRAQHLDFYGIEYGDHESALALGAGRAERRIFRGARVRLQRISAQSLERARCAAESLSRRALRGPGGLALGNPQAHRRPPLRPRADAHPHGRADGPPPLLADLRSRLRGRAAGRRPRVRL